MQITIFGASGKVGSLVVAEALRRGYIVTAFVHSHNPFGEQAGLRVVKGDVYNEQDIAQALVGSEAMVSCLGSWGMPKKDVLTAAMRAVVPAMQAAGVRRIITLTGSGALPPLQKPSLGHKAFLRLLSLTPAGKVFKDGEEHMRVLQQSGLDWTTVRSPVMTNKGNPGYVLSMRKGAPWASIHRHAVAHSMLDELEQGGWVGQAPIIHRQR